MLFNILVPLAEQFSALNVFRYITFRTGGAVITALIVSFLFGPVLIEMLKSRQGTGQPIRDLLSIVAAKPKKSALVAILRKLAITLPAIERIEAGYTT